MEINITLEQGIFLKRYKRFFADIKTDTETIVSHCPNTGSLKSINVPNSPCLFTRSNDPKRKLKATIEAIQIGTTWVGIHTGRANELVKELVLKASHLPYKEYKGHFSEVKISDQSRSDFVLHPTLTEKPKPADLKNGGYHIIEVKNVTMSEGKTALFPDAVTTRGQKHIEELMTLKNYGNTVEFIFLVQRTDCDTFSPATDIDPIYSSLL
ncbi:MAG: DNA/RNA nuclease SfsA, partial [Bdellovibrionales bacterium]|nr:DNA/RNA nuclease SfsA [Bdellovibrionales bacterium]